jgi:hypothetical protein
VYGGHSFSRVNFEQHPFIPDLMLSKDHKSNVVHVWQVSQGMYNKV